MNPHEMDGDISKLIALLKKLMKNHPQAADILNLVQQKKPFNLNVCFLTIVPMVPEELEEMQHLCEEYMSHIDEIEVPLHKRAQLEFKLSRDDMDFLKKHGIRF